MDNILYTLTNHQYFTVSSL